MKQLVVCLIAVAFGLAGMATENGVAYAQFGTGDCVRCGGTPGNPFCSGGLLNGSVACWVTGFNCVEQDPCYYAGGGSGCFVAGAGVETPNGTVPIEELRVGDKVLGLSADGETIINEVVETHRTLSIVHFVINGVIAVTGTHPFLVGRDWVEAQHIRVGDALTGDDGAPVAVNSIDIVENGVRVYNITVSGNHTFFACGSVVHNKEPVPGG